VNSDEFICGDSGGRQKTDNKKNDEQAIRFHKPDLHEDNLLNKLPRLRLETHRKKTTIASMDAIKKRPLLPADTQKHVPETGPANVTVCLHRNLHKLKCREPGRLDRRRIPR
jgi:hypothetical protein